MARLIESQILFTYKGRTVEVPGIIDTGAEGFAFVDNSVGDELGVKPTGRLSPYAGVGGQVQYGFTETLDYIGIKDNPRCGLTRPQVTVGPLNLRKGAIRALIGGAFMDQTFMKIHYLGGGKIQIQCGMEGKEGPFVAVSEDNTLYYILGAVALVGVLAFVLPEL